MRSEFANYKSQINYKKQITNLKQKPKSNIETDLFGSFYNWKLEFATPGPVEILFKFPRYPAVLSYKIPKDLV